MNTPTLLKLKVLVLAFLCCCNSAHAQDGQSVQWAGDPTDGTRVFPNTASYFNENYWRNFVVPGVQDDAVFNTDFFTEFDNPSSTEIYFGDFITRYISGARDVLNDAGTANPDRMIFQKGGWQLHQNGRADLSLELGITRPIVPNPGVIDPNSFLVNRGANVEIFGDASATTVNVGGGAEGSAGQLRLNGVTQSNFNVRDNIFVGGRGGEDGELAVEQSASLSGNALFLGGRGQGIANVSGQLSVSSAVLGGERGARGRLSLAGNTASLQSNFLTVGDSGQGDLLITAGAQGNVLLDACVGCLTGADGAATVQGLGSQLTGRRLFIGGASSEFVGGVPGQDVVGGAGELTVTQDGVVSVDELVNFETGRVNVSMRGSIVVDVFRNHGTLNLQSDDSLDVGIFENTGQIIGGGAVNFDTLEVNEGILVDDVAGNLVQNGGIVAPGNSPGLLSIDGDYTINDGLVEIEIGGLGASDQFDQISIFGNLAIAGGILDVTLIDGFSPTAGDEFQLFEASAISGEFSSLNLSEIGLGVEWNTSQLLSTGRLIAVSVPEPSSTVGLMVIACFATVLRRNRLLVS